MTRNQKYLKNGDKKMKIKGSNIIIHIICALAAIALWTVVMVDKNPINNKTFARIPVTITNADAVKNNGTYMIMDDLEKFTVNVTVSGLNNSLTNLETKDIKATAKIVQLKEGTNQVNVEVELPKDMEVKSISPNSLSYTVEQIVSVPVPIMVKYSGSQAEGYYLGPGVANPDTVYVRGARSIVNSVSSAVARVNLAGETESVLQNKPVILYDNTGNEISTNFLTITPNSVETSFEILPTKRVPVVAKVVGQVPEGYKLVESNIDLTTVEIAALPEVLSTINLIETETVDISDKTEQFDMAINLIVPVGSKVINGKNIAYLNVNIEEVVEKEIEYSFEDIELINKNEDFIYKSMEEDLKIKVVIKAIESKIDEILSTDIKLKVDVENFVEGDNNGALEVTTEKEIVEMTCEIENIGIRVSLEETNDGNNQTDNNGESTGENDNNDNTGNNN